MKRIAEDPPVYVNPNDVLAVYVSQGHGTVVLLSNGEYLTVSPTDTTEAVITALAEGN